MSTSLLVERSERPRRATAESRLGKVRSSAEHTAHPVKDYLSRISDMVDRKHDLDRIIFREVIERRDEDMGQYLNNHVSTLMAKDYREEIAKTCGSQLASSYQKRMSYLLNSIPMADNRVYGATLAMAKLSADLMKGFTPFITSFVLKVMQLCRSLGIRRLVICSRDGDVFFVIAKVLRQSLYNEIEVKLEPINRRLFGIEDKPIGIDGKDYSRLIEEAGTEVIKDKNRLEYLGRVFGGGDRVAILDSGVYGSIAGVIDYLHEMRAIRPQPFVFFFASRNPYIYGFVNQYLDKLPVSVTEWPCWLELFADTIEVFGKTYGSAKPLSSVNRVRLVARPIQSLLYEASSWGILVAARDYSLYELPKEYDKMERPDILLDDLYRLYRRMIEGKVIHSLFLEHHAPPSPYGSAVLQGWDRGIIPPLDLLLGYDHPRKYKVRSVCACSCYPGAHK